MTQPASEATFARQSGLTSAWPELLDALLRGVGHALSNRIGALMAVAELQADDSYPGDPAHLTQEIERLTELNRLLKLLPAESKPRSEALLPADALADALALMSLHPRARDVVWRRELTSDQPIRVIRHVLVRAMLLMFEAARVRAERAGTTTIDVVLGGDDELVTITTRVDITNEDAEGSDPMLAALAEAMDGVIASDATRVTLRLPTLSELRRRERSST